MHACFMLVIVTRQLVHELAEDTVYVCHTQMNVHSIPMSPGLVPMMLQCMIVNCVELLNIVRMLRTDCFGGIRLASHTFSSS